MDVDRCSREMRQAKDSNRNNVTDCRSLRAATSATDKCRRSRIRRTDDRSLIRRCTSTSTSSSPCRKRNCVSIVGEHEMLIECHSLAADVNAATACDCVRRNPHIVRLLAPRHGEAGRACSQRRCRGATNRRETIASTPWASSGTRGRGRDGTRAIATRRRRPTGRGRCAMLTNWGNSPDVRPM